MMNRISFLQGEEARLDRDIEAARLKALGLLSSKTEKIAGNAPGQEVADLLQTTTREVLQVLQQQQQQQQKSKAPPRTQKPGE